MKTDMYRIWSTRPTGKVIIDYMGDGRKMHILPREFDLGTVMRPTERKFGRFTERERFKPRETLSSLFFITASLVLRCSEEEEEEEEEEMEEEEEEEGENDFAPSLLIKISLQAGLPSMVPGILEAEAEAEAEAETEEEKEKPATLVVITE
ncbi:hypothetical protein BTUL_0156g00310 [Botrytis tulipae]|uniref:Uncharacterized protein n=1 Tax=Botrytis tulipae TaxID=87230 RepID=A0A4Z1EBZ4_9HELO|nr:hypothetical protein BTUL_0156g00310 [Botrytis tulipae]